MVMWWFVLRSSSLVPQTEVKVARSTSSAISRIDCFFISEKMSSVPWWRSWSPPSSETVFETLWFSFGLLPPTVKSQQKSKRALLYNLKIFIEKVSLKAIWMVNSLDSSGEMTKVSADCPSFLDDVWSLRQQWLLGSVFRLRLQLSENKKHQATVFQTTKRPLYPYNWLYNDLILLDFHHFIWFLNDMSGL